MSFNTDENARRLIAELGADASDPQTRDSARFAADRLRTGTRAGDCDQLRLAIENMTGGANTVLYDDAGRPSIMCALPMMTMDDLYGNGDDSPHPAWIVAGDVKKVIYVSKYMNSIEGGRAYSLPMVAPATYNTFDDCIEACLRKGRGWHLMTNAEWMAIAQWSKRNGTRPHGNTGAGCYHRATHERGVPATMFDGRAHLTKTGSGPVTWSHNHDVSGITDLVGNMFEWVGGLRLMDGVFQIIPNNDAALYDANLLKADSRRWRALTTDGVLAAHGELDTLKVDGDVPGDMREDDHLIGSPIVSTGIAHRSYLGIHTDGNQAYLDCDFCDLRADSSTPVPRIAQVLGMLPDETCTHEDGIFVARNYGERIAVRGGKAGSLDRAGLNALHFYNPRTYDGSATIGFRCAYVDLDM